jgi:hypothetical protein
MPRKAYFDMGRFGTGIVFGVELQNAKEAVRNMKPGDKMHAKIVALDGEGGPRGTFALGSRQAEALAANERARRIGRGGKSENRRSECRRPYGSYPGNATSRRFSRFPSSRSNTIRKFRMAIAKRSQRSLRNLSARSLREDHRRKSAHK